ncbi:hypothetical protein RRSWK_04030 [Rhodopirellula sp. SWK7]|nr:hypothetical protein RRSWK_04030 [Rhodopirellula sp. SWK7]
MLAGEPFQKNRGYVRILTPQSLVRGLGNRKFDLRLLSFELRQATL